MKTDRPTPPPVFTQEDQYYIRVAAMALKRISDRHRISVHIDTHASAVGTEYDCIAVSIYRWVSRACGGSISRDFKAPTDITIEHLGEMENEAWLDAIKQEAAR